MQCYIFSVAEQCTFEGKDLCNWEIKNNAEKQEDLYTYVSLV